MTFRICIVSHANSHSQFVRSASSRLKPKRSVAAQHYKRRQSCNLEHDLTGKRIELARGGMEPVLYKMRK
jgi:hypothetical protein